MKNAKSLYVSVDRLTLVLYGEDAPGCVYSNYSSGRKVCGIVCATGGEAEYLFSDGRVRVMKAGEVALFSHKSAYIVRNNTETFSHYTINFELNPGYELPDNEFFCLPQNCAIISSYCEKILSYWNSGEPVAPLNCISVLYSILAQVFAEKTMDRVGKRSYTMVLPAINYIDKNYGRKISIDYLAKKCIMSSTNFRRCFTAVVGKSPIEYLLCVRIKRAVELLYQSSFSISEIAAVCGFKDVEYFCRVFKRRTGVTPSCVRRAGVCEWYEKEQ